MGYKKGTITRRWTKDEEDFLKENYTKIRIEDLMFKLNRPYYSVLEKANNLKLRKIKSWSTKDIEFLKNNYQNMSLEEMARILNASHSSIGHKLSRLKLTRRIEWNKDKVTNALKSFKIINGEKVIKKKTTSL